MSKLLPKFRTRRGNMSRKAGDSPDFFFASSKSRTGRADEDTSTAFSASSEHVATLPLTGQLGVLDVAPRAGPDGLAVEGDDADAEQVLLEQLRLEHVLHLAHERLAQASDLLAREQQVESRVRDALAQRQHPAGDARKVAAELFHPSQHRLSRREAGDDEVQQAVVLVAPAAPVSRVLDVFVPADADLLCGPRQLPFGLLHDRFPPRGRDFSRVVVPRSLLFGCGGAVRPHPPTTLASCGIQRACAAAPWNQQPSSPSVTTRPSSGSRSSSSTAPSTSNLDVPADVFEAFLAADSKGSFFNSDIKNSYAFVPISR